MTKTLRILLAILLILALITVIFLFFPKKTAQNGQTRDLRRFPVGTEEDSVAHWKTRENLETPSIVVETKTGTTEYQLSKEDRWDYLGNILFSPNQDFVCVESGASGYWGYLVGKVEGSGIQKILSGMQYSYCLSWLDENRVLLQEKPYSEPSKTYYYSYNVLTAERSLLFTENVGYKDF